MHGQTVKPQSNTSPRQASTMRLESSNSVLSRKLAALLEQRDELSRLDHSRAMGVSDGTLGRIKYGTGNPTLEVVDAIGKYFRVPAWRLLQPEQADELLSSEAWSTTSPSHGRLATTLMHSGPRLSPAAAEAIEALVRELTAAGPEESDHRARATASVAALFFKRGRAPEGPLFLKAVAELEAAYRRNEAMDQADGLIDDLLTRLSTSDERA